MTRRRGRGRSSRRTGERTTAAANLFERLNEGRPQQAEKVTEQQDDLKTILMRVWTQPIGPKHSPIERLLDWLINHGNKTTVTAREIDTSSSPAAETRKRPYAWRKLSLSTDGSKPLETSRRDNRKWHVLNQPRMASYCSRLPRIR